MREYDYEPVPGLPESLPKGERILWQGAPEWRALTRQIFHPVAVTLYYSVFALWFFAAALHDGRPFGEAIAYVGYTAIVAAISVGLLCVLGYVMSRTTLYTITNRRVVMRFGVAFPMAVNLPFTSIEGASFKAGPGGSGNLPLELNGDGRLAYLHMWPHVRPGRFKSAQPMLRAIPDAANVAALLKTAWSVSLGQRDADADAAQAPVSVQAPRLAKSTPAYRKPHAANAAA
jgi:hypothetical protein